MDPNGAVVSQKPNVLVPLCANVHHQILHLPAIREDIIAARSAIAVLASVGASTRTALSLLVLERVL